MSPGPPLPRLQPGAAKFLGRGLGGALSVDQDSLSDLPPLSLRLPALPSLPFLPPSCLSTTRDRTEQTVLSSSCRRNSVSPLRMLGWDTVPTVFKHISQTDWVVCPCHVVSSCACTLAVSKETTRWGSKENGNVDWDVTHSPHPASLVSNSLLTPPAPPATLHPCLPPNMSPDQSAAHCVISLDQAWENCGPGALCGPFSFVALWIWKFYINSR